ncbi:disease resistance protein At4g27190-like isoform X2 [Pistacia vera]|uniref:disease resistance protein At4g27190-like isoform X2 n=1 Tax=Pistacia vera TaxID=55513 RepID=UPI001262DC9E|nr:disease resistance protein At4g27190-like isoform X2 [Pistacia vera]
MEIVAPCMEHIVSAVEENLLELTKRHVRYLFCFKSIVKDFKDEFQNLESTRDGVQQDVDSATNNTKVIKKDVHKWLKKVDEVVKDVQKLEEEIEENKASLVGRCPNWVLRYRLSRKAEHKRHNMLKLQGIGKFEKVSHPATLPGIEFSVPKDFQLFKSAEPAFHKIIKELESDETHLVGLYGMGGVGKTTLAKAVGKKVKEEKIFDEVVIIIVSQAPNFKKIQGDLAESLDMKLEEEGEERRAKHLHLRFVETKKKILIILDDVWKKFDLKSKIGFPFGDDLKGCKILLTTRSQNVCIRMSCQPRVLLNELNEDEGLALLKKHAGITDDESHPLNDLAVKVAEECKGLPLAIVTIGSALKEKGIDEWTLVFEKFKKSKLVDIHKDIDVDDDVYAILKVSYDYLESKETKLCFLLCSLFPEDYEIPLEELVRYGMGLGLFPDVDSIEQARRQLRVMVNKLIASCLLIDAGVKGFVKMHDVIRDVALGIASKGDIVFLVKAGLGLTEWPKEGRHLGQHTAISLMDNEIHMLPDHLVCPKLETLLLSRQYCYERRGNIEVSNHFFEEMKALKNVSLSYVVLSLKSLKFLTDLKTLELIDCNLRDISSLEHLARLEILSLRYSWFDEFPKELGALTELRLLDLRDCSGLKRIPSNVISRFSQLEELYADDYFDEREDEETSTEGSNASLSELNSLSNLVVLFLKIKAKCLSEDLGFICNKLQRYDICVNSTDSEFYHVSKSRRRALTVTKIEAASLIALKYLYHTLEYLAIQSCNKLEEIFQLDGLCHNREENVAMLSSLAELDLKELPQLRCIWKGPTHIVNLKSLTKVEVRECKSLIYLFTLSVAQSLVQLKSLEVSDCESLKHLIVTKEGDNDKEEEILPESHHAVVVLPNLEKLSILKLPQLRCIWSGPSYHVKLPSLTDVGVRECKTLIYLFTLSVAQSLVQLKSLKVSDCESLEHLVITEEGDNDEISSEHDLQIHSPFLSKLESLKINSCERLEHIFPVSFARVLVQLEEFAVENAPQLKQVFYLDNGSEENVVAGDGKETAVIKLPKLKVLRLDGLASMISFCPENFHSSWPALEDFTIDECSNLSMSFVTEVVSKVRDLQENLRILRIGSWNQLYDTLLSGLKDGFFKNLEELSINRCGVKVLFPLEDGEQHTFSLPYLKTLQLEYLPQLEGLCSKSPTLVSSLENLTTLYLYHCDRLRNIFSASLAQNLSQLQVLRISDCGELEEIIVEEDEENQILFFQNLLQIIVRGCPKIRRLFAITVAPRLQKLKEIFVYDNSELEEVFGDKDVADVMDHKEITLPQLNSMVLYRLSSLSKFCPVGYHFIFPSLRSVLIIKGCPKMSTRFSMGEDRCVHAKAKAFQIAEFPSEPFIEIKCLSFYEIQQSLPLYIENNEQSINQQEEETNTET